MIRLNDRLPARMLGDDMAVSRSPWPLFIFLFLVFAFAAPYQLDYTVQEHDLDEKVDGVEAGNLGRQLAVPILGAYGLGLILVSRKRRLQINGGTGLAVASFLAVTFCSMFWAEDPLLTIKKLIVFGLVMLGAVGIAQQFTRREIVLFAAFIGYGVIALALGMELWFGSFLRAPEYGTYQFAGVMHPNSTAVYCAVACLSTLTLAHLEPRRRRWFLLLTAVGAGFLLLTKSRTAFGSTAATLIIYWLLTTTVKHKFRLFLGLGIIACGLGLIFSEDLITRLTDAFLLGRGEEESGSLSNRWPLWQECLDYVAQRPLLGYGFDAFWTPQHIYAISKHQGWAVPHSHNGYLEMLLNLGVIGLLIYVIMIASYLRTTFIDWLASKDPAYLYGLVMVVWFCLEMTLERVPIFPSFVCNLLIARSAFVQTEEQDPLTLQPA